MKKVALIFPVFILLSLVLVTTALEVRRVPDWQRTLGQYIASRQSTEQLTVVAATQADKPWNFDASKGYAVQDGEWPWNVDSLPYPPTALHCVLARGGFAEMTDLRLIFVGYHTDALWRVGWIVHEGARVDVGEFSPETSAQLDALGCHLNLSPSKEFGYKHPGINVQA